MDEPIYPHDGTSGPIPAGYILVTDCPCGENHLAPDDEGYQAISEYIAR